MVRAERGLKGYVITNELLWSDTDVTNGFSLLGLFISLALEKFLVGVPFSDAPDFDKHRFFENFHQTALGSEEVVQNSHCKNNYLGQIPDHSVVHKFVLIVVKP